MLVWLSGVARARAAAILLGRLTGSCLGEETAADPLDGFTASGPGMGALIAQVAVSLAVVLGLVWLLAFLGRFLVGRSQQKGTARSRVVEVIARQAIGPKRMIELVKVGGRVIVVGSDQAGMRTLTEFRDRGDVERLISDSEQVGPAAPAFSHILARACGRSKGEV